MSVLAPLFPVALGIATLANYASSGGILFVASCFFAAALLVVATFIVRLPSRAACNVAYTGIVLGLLASGSVIGGRLGIVPEVIFREPTCAKYSINATANADGSAYQVSTLVQCPPSNAEALVIVTEILEGTDRHPAYYFKQPPAVSHQVRTVPIFVESHVGTQERKFFIVSLSSEEFIELFNVHERTAKPGVYGSEATAITEGNIVASTRPE